jgi:WD40 repeat protein
MAEHKSIYTVGGTVRGVYIERAADTELLELCRKGDLAFILASRQVGKSSLMVHTAEKLKNEGVHSAIVDLSAIGVDISAQEWYLGILKEIAKRLGLQINIFTWWEEHSKLGHAQRLKDFFEDVLLKEIGGRIVLFFDEIDSMLSIAEKLGSSFSDDFFAALRASYNARSTIPDFKRLAFVLIGVASPGELMSDIKRTPFNIGQRVDLTDFTLEEAKLLASGFKDGSMEVLKWVFEWTNGHPYLTQRLCAALANETDSLTREVVAKKAHDLFIGESGQGDSNIQFVRGMLLERAANPVEVLGIYQQVLNKEKVEDNEHSLSKAQLKLSGVVRRGSSKLLRVSNQIYFQIFGLEWVKEYLTLMSARDPIRIRALDWDRMHRDRSKLLRGKELVEAEQLLLRNELPDVSKKGIVQDFVVISRRNQERERNLILIGLGLIVFAMILISGFAWVQRTNAIHAQATSTNALADIFYGAQTKDAILTSKAQLQQTANVNSTIVANANATSTSFAAAATGTAAVSSAVSNEVTKNLSESLARNALSKMDSNYIYGLLQGVESYRVLDLKKISEGQARDAIPPLLDQLPRGLLQNLELSSGPIHKVLYSPDGSLLVALSNTVNLWDTRDPASPQSFPGWHAPVDAPSDAAFSPDGKRIVIGYQNGRVEIWSVSPSSISLLYSSNDFSSSVRVAVSTDGKILAAGDQALEFWDISNPSSPRLLGGMPHPHAILDRIVNVNYLAFMPGSNSLLVTGGLDHYLDIWNFTKSSYKPTSMLWRTPIFYVDPPPVALNSNYLIMADKASIWVYFYFSTGDRQKADAPLYHQVHQGLIKNMVISPDGKKLYTTAQDGIIAIWSLDDPRHVEFIDKFDVRSMQSINSIATHPDGDILAVADDNTIALWSLNGRESAPLWRSQITKDQADITDIAYSPKLNLLAVGDHAGVLNLWNVQDPSHRNVRRHTSIKNPIHSLAFYPDDTELWFLGDFASDATNPRVYSRDLTRLDVSENKNPFGTYTADVFAVGKNYILAGEDDHGKIYIVGWDISRDALNRDPSLGRAECPFKDTTYTHEGSLVAVASCTVQLWNFPGDGLPTLLDDLGGGKPAAVAFNRDGSLLASGNENGTISLWKIGSEGKAQLLTPTATKANTGAVTAVAISPDNMTLASGGEDQDIILWDISNPGLPTQRVTLHGHTGTVLNGGLFFLSDGKTLVSATSQGVIFWDVDPQSWIDKACRLAGRNFTESEFSQFVSPTDRYHVTCPDLPVPEN